MSAGSRSDNSPNDERRWILLWFSRLRFLFFLLFVGSVKSYMNQGFYKDYFIRYSHFPSAHDQYTAVSTEADNGESTTHNTTYIHARSTYNFRFDNILMNLSLSKRFQLARRANLRL